MSFVVPAIDISPFVMNGSPESKHDVARRLNEACRTVGFIQIHGHGIPDDIIAGLASAIDAFFELDLDVKKRYRTPPGINRGYAPPKSEAISLSLGIEPADKMNDFFEAFNVGLDRTSYRSLPLPELSYQANVWPDEQIDFKAPVEAYFSEARRVANLLVQIFSEALSLPDGFFDSLTDYATGTMRINNYALAPGDIQLDGDLRGMGEHTDYGIVTVLWADQVKGLQVLGVDGGWHDVSPEDGSLLVNLGDVSARWTNERWMSTLHRVRPPIIDGRIERRRSVAYFHGANFDALVGPLDELLEPGEEPLYDAVTSAEHGAAKLAGSRAGVLNASAPREAARVRSAAS